MERLFGRGREAGSGDYSNLKGRSIVHLIRVGDKVLNFANCVLADWSAQDQIAITFADGTVMKFEGEEAIVIRDRLRALTP